MSHEVIDLTDNEQSTPEPLSRRDILAPAIRHVIAALGGFEATSTGNTYVLGDECHGCLKDLKRFWRKDDTDDERTVARIFYEAGVLQNDLIPIVLETAGKGDIENKCAITAVDLITGMTWPIDIAAELKELDEEEESTAVDYTTLITAQLTYKRAMVTNKDALSAIFDLVVPCMAKQRWDRTERDKQIVTLILYLIRNLAFIRDLPINTNLSAGQAELSTLQSRYVSILHETLILDFLLTFASNAIDDPFANAQNTLILEIFYLLFRSLPPSSILPSIKGSGNTAPKPNDALRTALDAEFRSGLLQKRHLTSRHSRFGTTIKVASSQTGQSLVLHRGAAAIQGKETGEILDRGKKKLAKRARMKDELTGGEFNEGSGPLEANHGVETKLSSQAREGLGVAAKIFIESCFNPFLGSLIKDIRAERSKVSEKDNLRLLFITKFFIQFFLAIRERDIKEGAAKSVTTTSNVEGMENGSTDHATEVKEPPPQSDEAKMSLGYALVLEVVQRGWAGWILRRMREATDMKPKQWTEIQAALGCLTQLLLLVDAMSTSSDEELSDAAGTLQYQVYYNGEALERMLECMRSFKDQSFGYLEASVQLAYVLLRMLERWGKKSGGLYIRKTKKKKGSKRTGAPEEAGVVDDVSEDDNEAVSTEILQEMTLEKFEGKFASEDITSTLMAYLSNFRTFDSAEKMKWVTNLMHRQAVRARAEGLFFKVSILAQFKVILSQQRTLPKDQSYKDLVALITFLIRQFFKAVEANPMVIAEAFFPKNRGMWKALSSWEPPEKKKKGREGGDGGGVDDTDEETGGHFPPDIRIKRGHSWSEQLAIAIGCLCEKEERDLVEWTKELLRLIIGVRQLTIDEVDGAKEVAIDSDSDGEVSKSKANAGPSAEALSKIEDFVIPYTKDGHAEAASRNPHLKLLFTLIGFEIADKTTNELEWICPASKQPAELQRCLNLIGNFLLDPLDLNGKKALQMVSKVTKRKKRRTAPDGYDSLQDDDPDRLERGKRRKAKKQNEKQAVLSAQLIEDSDAELGDDDAFFAAEAAMRARTAKAADDAGVATQRTGTKKRKKKDESDDGMDSDRSGTRKKARKSIEPKSKRKPAMSSDEENSDSSASSSDRDAKARRSKPANRRRKNGNGGEHRESLSASSPPPPPSRAPSSIADSSEADDDDEDEDKGDAETALDMSVPNTSHSQRKLQRLSGTIGSSASEMEEDDVEDITAVKQATRPARRLVLSDEEDE